MSMIDQDFVRDIIERHSDALGGNGRDFHNGAYVAIANELNSTLGSCNCSNSERTNGTCIPVLDSERDGMPYLNPRFVCSECGCQLTKSRLGKVWQNFCPNCGRRVVTDG